MPHCPAHVVGGRRRDLQCDIAHEGELLEKVHGRAKTANHSEEMGAQVRRVEEIVRLIEGVFGNNVNGDAAEGVVQVDWLLSGDAGTGEGDDLVGLAVDDVFKFEHHFAREHGVQAGALALVDLVGGRRVSRVRDTQRAVVDGALGVFGADMVDGLEVLLVAEVNLIGLNADNWA